MWPFKKKPESPQEIAAEQRLDRAAREAGWDELDEAREKDAEAVQRDVAFGGSMIATRSALNFVESEEGERGP
jgi:hypothetical protein